MREIVTSRPNAAKRDNNFDLKIRNPTPRLGPQRKYLPHYGPKGVHVRLLFFFPPRKACRNLLVLKQEDEWTSKVTDFGLSRTTGASSAYRTHDGKFAVTFFFSDFYFFFDPGLRIFFFWPEKSKIKYFVKKKKDKMEFSGVFETRNI